MKARWIVRAMITGIVAPCMHCRGVFVPQAMNRWFCRPCVEDPRRGLTPTLAYRAGMRTGRDLAVKAICGVALEELEQKAAKEAKGCGS